MKLKIATLAFSLAAAHSAQAGLVDWTFSSTATYSDTMAAVPKPTAGHGSYESTVLESSTLRVVSSLPTKSSNTGVLELKRTTSNNGATELNASRLVLELNPASSVTSLGTIKVTYEARATVSGGNPLTIGSLTWTYAIGLSGSTPNLNTFQPIPDLSPQQLSAAFPSSPYATPSFDPGTISSGQSIYLLAQPSGFAGNQVNFAMDNVGVSAVPEPTNIALAIFGVGALGVTAGRRFFKKTSTSQTA